MYSLNDIFERHRNLLALWQLNGRAKSGRICINLYNYDFVVLFGEHYEFCMPVKANGLSLADAMQVAAEGAADKAGMPATAAIYFPGNRSMTVLKEVKFSVPEAVPYKFKHPVQPVIQ